MLLSAQSTLCLGSYLVLHFRRYIAVSNHCPPLLKLSLLTLMGSTVVSLGSGSGANFSFVRRDNCFPGLVMVFNTGLLLTQLALS